MSTRQQITEGPGLHSRAEQHEMDARAFWHANPRFVAVLLAQVRADRVAEPNRSASIDEAWVLAKRQCRRDGIRLDRGANNTWRSHIARFLMTTYADLDGHIAVRDMTSTTTPARERHAA